MNKFRQCPFIVLFLLAISCGVVSAGNGEEALQKVTLQLKWKHQFQFAGYYAAIEKGYYKAAGLAVELREAREDSNPNNAVFEGKADFGISSSEVLRLRDHHPNTVILASIFQHSPSIIISLDKTGIRHAFDLVGKKIALDPNSCEIESYLASEGIKPEEYTLVPQSFDIQKFLKGEMDAMSAYSTDETFALEEAGVSYTVLSPIMAGIDYYGDVLFTTSELIRTDPEMVRKFRKASLDGWNYAMDHPAELIDLIYSKYSQRHSIPYLRHEADHMKSLVMEELVEIGYSNPERWNHMMTMLKNLNLINKSQNINGLLYSDYSGTPRDIPWNIILPFLIVILFIASLSYFFYFTSRKLKVEVAQREKIQVELTRSEELYRSILTASPDSIIITDMNGLIRLVSPSALKMFARDEEELPGKPLISFLAAEDKQKAMDHIDQMKLGNFSGVQEYTGMHSNGTLFPVEVTGEIIRRRGGEPTGFVFITRNIADRKKNEEKILKANRFYEFISKINQAIVLIRDKDQLLSEVCRIAIDTGKFRMAWFGVLDEQSNAVVPKVFAGEENGYLTSIKQISVKDVEEGRGPTGTAIREGKYFVCNDIENDPSMELWKSEAMSRGYLSCISIPVILSDRENAAMILYAPLSHFFDQEETELLVEVVNNLSFALESLEKDQQVKDLNANLELKIEHRTSQLALSNKILLKEIEDRNKVENALVDSEQRYKTVVENIREVIFYTDKDGLWVFLNKPWTEITGFSLMESLGKPSADFVHPDDRANNMELFLPLIRREKEYCRHEVRYLTKDGNYRWIEVFTRLQIDILGEVTGTYGTLRDISEQKFAKAFETELLQLTPQLTGLPLQKIDPAIHISLSRIGQFLGADRAYIFEFNWERETMSNTFEWCNEGINPEIDNFQDVPNDALPNWMMTLKRLENILIPSVKDLPASWQTEREMLEPLGIQSLVVIPMLSENNLIGFVGLDTVLSGREFSEAEINILKVWSSLLASLINNKRRDLLLEQTRQNYETFFNTIDDFLWVLDEHGKIIHVNNTVKDRLEYTPEELKDLPLLMVHPPARREEAARIVGEMLAGVSEFCPVPIVSKSGLHISVETRVKSGFWNNQSVVFGVSKDISQIELSEQKFSKAFQANSVMMSIAHFDSGVFLDVNNEFIETIGYSRDEVIGKTSGELRLFVDPNISKEIRQSLNNKIPVRKKEIQLRIMNGTIRTVLISCDSIYIGNNHCLLCATVDITERIKGEEELREARIEAEQANMAKSEFLSRMSHELRTPMNSILGFAQLLEMGELNSGQKKGVSHIKKSGKHLLKLINEVLDISRIEAGHLSISLEPVNILEVINEMIDIVRQPALEKLVTLEIDGSGDKFLYLKSDKQRLKQILLNLLNNAIKYNKMGGSVFLETRLMPLNRSGVKPVRITLRDSGLGISASDIPKLFNPFERIGAEKTDTEGTGLGLSVVKKLTDAMGGEIGVESVVGEGSTFWVEFPSCEGGNELSRKISSSEEISQKAEDKQGIILYVEDNASNIVLFEEILSSQRSNIHLITNTQGLNTVPLALEFKPDLILLDLNLPDCHGSEVLRQLQLDEKTSDIPVVVISADAMAHQISQLMGMGARRYVTKPLDLDVLLKIIDEYITGAV